MNFNNVSDVKIKEGAVTQIRHIATDTVLWLANTVKRITGLFPMIINNIRRLQNLILFEFTGNSIQNGTPSFTNPVDINSVGNPMKSIFDFDQVGIKSMSPKSGTVSGIEYAFNSDGTLWLNGTASKSADVYIEGSSKIAQAEADLYNTQKDAGTYTLKTFKNSVVSGSFDGSSVQMFFVTYKSDFSTLLSINTTTGASADRTFTLDVPAAYTRALIRIPAGVVCNDLVIAPVLVKGEFVGYDIPVKVTGDGFEKITTICLPEPIRKLNNYVDTLSINEAGKIEVVRNVKMSELKWAVESTSAARWHVTPGDMVNVGTSRSTDVVSTHVPTVTYPAASADGVFAYNAKLICYRRPFDPDVAPIGEYTYPLATPVIEEYDGEAISIPAGTSTIEILTDVQPTNGVIEYQ